MRRPSETGTPHSVKWRRSWSSGAPRRIVMRVSRPFRIVVHILAVAQLLLSPVAVSALTTGPATAASEMPCADTMPHADDQRSCPCCPDGANSVAACLSNCAASVGAISSFELPISTLLAMPLPAMPLTQVARIADPPLKPPPIV